MAQRELVLVRGPITAGCMSETDLKAMRAIYVYLNDLVALNADKGKLTTILTEIADNTSKTIEAVYEANTLATQASEMVKNATTEIDEKSTVILTEINTARSEVSANAKAVSEDCETVESLAKMVEGANSEACSARDEVKAKATEVATHCDEVKANATAAAEAAEIATNAAKSAGFSYRYAENATENATISISDLTPSTNVKIGDHVINSSGNTFEIVAVDGTSCAVGPVLCCLKGEKGEKGDSGVSNWSDIVDKPFDVYAFSEVRTRDASKPTYGLT